MSGDLTLALVSLYALIGMFWRFKLLRYQLRTGWARNAEDRFYDFLACVGMWPVFMWFILGMLRTERKGGHV